MTPKTVTVEFVLVGKNDSPITTEDAECMSAVAESIRLSARLVDMPCQDMHTSAFVQVNINNTVEIYIYMLFAGWEVHIVKNCDWGLENAAFSSPRSKVFTIWTDPRPEITFFFFKLSNEKKTHASVTVTVVRDGKICTALRTNQIVGFVTVPASKKLIVLPIFNN